MADHVAKALTKERTMTCSHSPILTAAAAHQRQHGLRCESAEWRRHPRDADYAAPSRWGSLVAGPRRPAAGTAASRPTRFGSRGVVAGMSPDPAATAGGPFAPERADRPRQLPGTSCHHPSPVRVPLPAQPARPAIPSPAQENAMTATVALAEAAETLFQTATRLQRVGLIVDRRALSPAQRRAAFVLQCRAVQKSDRHPPRPAIGFAYPNAR
jgi:hypothetical protein